MGGEQAIGQAGDGAAERSWTLPGVDRGQLTAVVMLAAVINAILPVAQGELAARGILPALSAGLGASWAFWLSFGLSVRFALKAPAQPATRQDIAVAAVSLLLILLPFRMGAALAATGFGAWLMFRPGRGAELRAAGLLLLAMAVNLYWAHLFMTVFAKPIAVLDGYLVNLFTGTHVQGNTVAFADGGKGFVIFGACTSVKNVSMALLLWLAITRSVRPGGARVDILTGAGVLATVFILNDIRLSLMARSARTFDYWHEGTGAELITLSITAMAVVWAVIGVRRELFR